MDRDSRPSERGNDHPHGGVAMMRYSVCFRAGEWRVYDRRGTWADRFPTLTAAHTWATQCAIVDELCAPGGLTRFKSWADIVFGPSEWVWCERNKDG